MIEIVFLTVCLIVVGASLGLVISASISDRRRTVPTENVLITGLGVMLFNEMKSLGLSSFCLAAFRERHAPSEGDLYAAVHSVFNHFCARFVADGLLEKRETASLALIANRLNIAKSEASELLEQAKRTRFTRAAETALADEVLSDDEFKHLTNVRQSLQLPDVEGYWILDNAMQLSRARKKLRVRSIVAGMLIGLITSTYLWLPQSHSQAAISLAAHTDPQQQVVAVPKVEPIPALLQSMPEAPSEVAIKPNNFLSRNRPQEQSQGDDIPVEISEPAKQPPAITPSSTPVTKFDWPSFPQSSSPSSSGYSGGTVHVKGYYRKDGSYVAPHTRSAPRKR